MIAEYIDIPFKEKGRTRKGADCWGLVLLVLKEQYGVTGLPDFRKSYSHTGDREGIKDCVTDEAHNWVKVSEPEKGAVIVFNIGGYPQHVGICTGFKQGKAMFLHVHKGANSTHERLSSSLWNQRIAGIYKYE